MYQSSRLIDLSFALLMSLGLWALYLFGRELLSPPLELSSGELYTLCLLYLVGVSSHAWLLQRVARYSSVIRPISSRNHSLIAYLAGGVTRLIQVSLIRLTALDAIEVTAHRTAQRIGPLPEDVTPVEELIYYLIPTEHDLSFYELELRLRSVGALDYAGEQLVSRGLMVRGLWRRRLLLSLSLLPYITPLLLIELAPIELLEAHLPHLGILDVGLTFWLYLTLMVWMTLREGAGFDHTTTAGERWLKLAQGRLKRAPKRDHTDLKWACQALALGGVKALRGTTFYSLAQLVKVSRPWLRRPEERTLLEHVLDGVEIDPFDILNQDY